MPPPKDPYRAAPPRRAPRVIETSTIAPRTLLVVWGIVTVGLVLLSQRVELTCDRAPSGGVCEIRAASLWSSGEPRRVPLADVMGARVEDDDGASRVTLLTKGGQVPLTNSSESGLGDEKQAMVAE